VIERLLFWIAYLTKQSTIAYLTSMAKENTSSSRYLVIFFSGVNITIYKL
jgi:hypothetical protein